LSILAKIPATETPNGESFTELRYHYRSFNMPYIYFSAGIRVFAKYRMLFEHVPQQIVEEIMGVCCRFSREKQKTIEAIYPQAKEEILRRWLLKTD